MWSYICSIIQAEVQGLCSKANMSILRKTDKESLSKFSWAALHVEWEKRAPHFLRVLTSAAQNISAMGKNVQKTPDAIRPAILCAGCKLVNIHSRDMNALRRINSILFKKGGLKKYAFRILTHTYDSLDYGTTIKMLDSFCINHDEKLLVWQKEVADSAKREQELKRKISRMSLSLEPSAKLATEVLKNDLHLLLKYMHPGYSFTSDNVDIQIKVRHMTRSRQNKDYHLYNMIAYKNRVSGNNLPNDIPVVHAEDIPLTTFLPNAEDNRHFLKEFGYLVAKVWAKHIPAMEWFSAYLPDHLPHEHENEVLKKTERVGSYIDFEGVIQINKRKYLQTYFLFNTEDT